MPLLDVFEIAFSSWLSLGYENITDFFLQILILE